MVRAEKKSIQKDSKHEISHPLDPLSFEEIT